MQKNKFKGYKIEFTKSAAKTFKKLDIQAQKKIDEKLKDLINGAPNVDIKPLEATAIDWRLRWGKYRIIFEDHKHIITVLVVEVSHRKEAYREF